MASESFTVDILHNVDSIFIYYKFHDSTSKQIEKDISYSNCLGKFKQTIESGNIDAAVQIMDSCEILGEKYDYNSFDTLKLSVSKIKEYDALILSFCDSVKYNSHPVLDGFTIEVTVNCNGLIKNMVTYTPNEARNFYVFTLLRQTFDIYRNVIRKKKNTFFY